MFIILYYYHHHHYYYYTIALREQLIFEEEELQRIRAMLSHISLTRIHLLIDEHVDFTEAHKNIAKAFQCCASIDEHNDLLSSMHAMLKEFVSLKRTEMSLSKQIVRHERGPIAEAHIGEVDDDDHDGDGSVDDGVDNDCSWLYIYIYIVYFISSLSILYLILLSFIAILLELESLYPQSADVHEWLGYRYTEKCDFEAARHHFKRLRDILEPVPCKEDTLLLWGSSFNLSKRYNDISFDIYSQSYCFAAWCIIYNYIINIYTYFIYILYTFLINIYIYILNLIVEWLVIR